MLLPNWLWIILILAVFIVCMVYMEFIRSKFVLSTTHKAVTVNGLPRVLDGMKFVLISDLHNMSFGEKNSELARKVRRERPDYILFAGNMGDAKAEDIEAFYNFLDSVGRDIPVVMVPGKDDLRLGNGTLHKNFVKSVQEAGGVILNNSRAEINVDGEKLYIYGYCPGLKADENKPIKDWKFQKVRSNDVFDTLGECPQDATVILLTGYAKGFEAYSRWGATLVFAGGTHGGYYRIPFIDRIIRSNKIAYTSGEYRIARSKMYVTRGLGSPSRIRFNNPPEISVICITRPNSPLLNTMPVSTDNAYDVFMYWARSEGRAIRDLLNERTDALHDWWDNLTHKEQSVYAKRGTANKEKTVYMSPQERIKENARRAKRSGSSVRRVSRVRTRSEYISELQAEMGNSDAVHSYDKFKTAEEIDKIKVFGDIKL
ncbi:MAG: metallophosphoesterase [Clostridia bacterium]|nr:metallophosphoesterase [Clostridia bacterium]